MTGLVSDGHTIERYHKKYFAQTNNLTIPRNVNKENRLCLVIYNCTTQMQNIEEIANAAALGPIVKYIIGLFMLGQVWAPADCQQNNYVQQAMCTWSIFNPADLSRTACSCF